MVAKVVFVTCKSSTFQHFHHLTVVLLTLQKEPISQVRQRIQAKLDVPDKEFEKV